MEEAFVEVGGQKYKLIKTGRGQARQVVQVTRWISQHGLKAAQSMNLKPEDAISMTGVAFLSKFAEALDENALIDLFSVLVGCDKEVSEIHFDIATLVDVAMQVYEGQPAIQKLLNRFFSQPKSESSMDESSTTSEQLTDGATS